MSEAAIAYLKRRGIPFPLPEGTGRLDDSNPDYPIVLPLRDASGEIVGLERHAIRDDADPKIMTDAGSIKRGSTFGALSGDAARVWIVEGFTDYLAAESMAGRLGVEVLGVPGAGLAEGIVEARAEQLREKISFLSFDNDPEGEKATKAARRALDRAGARPVVAKYPDGFKDLCEIIEKAGIEKAGQIMAEIFAGSAPRDTWRSLPTVADVLASMPPPSERIPTGVPALDRYSRGGLARGRVYMIVGPPGRGKTSLVKQLGGRLAREHNAIVVGFFCDEGAWQAGVMLGQGIGFERSALEDHYAEIAERFARESASLDIRLPNPDDPETVIEAARRWLVDVPPERLVVLLVDSVQHVRCAAAAEAESRKERTDLMMTALRRLARDLNAVVLATSRANRASYSRKDSGENVAPIASGLDSSSIEYDSDAFFFLESDRDAGDVTTLFIQKNRPGDGQTHEICLRFDRERAEFAELDSEIVRQQAQEGKATAYRAKIGTLKGEIRKILRSRAYQSGRAILAALKAAGVQCRNDDFWPALHLLETEGLRLAKPPGGGREGYLLDDTEEPS